MESLYIKGSENNPEFDFNSDGNLNIKGVSLPDNVLIIHQQLNEWLELFEKALPQEVKLTLYMEYFNTASTWMLVQIIKKISTFNSDKCKVNVTWYYGFEDDDMLADGQKIEDIVNFKFNFKELPSA